MSPEGGPGGEFYVEFFRQGNAVKATAIDPVSGIEASIVGPAGAPTGDLQALAVAKLRRALGEKRSPKTKAPAVTRRGIIV